MLCVNHQISHKNRNYLVGSTLRYKIMNQLAPGGIGSVWGGSGWYLVELGFNRAVLVGTWWYWVSIGQYGLI